MSKKNGNVLEKYIDKIILGIVGIISLYILIAYVLISPNTIQYNGKKYGPGDLDKAIRAQANAIEEKLNSKESIAKVYQPKRNEFNSIFASPLKNIDENIFIQFPVASQMAGEKQVYDVPKVCDINNVKVRTMTAVAYVPKVPLMEDQSYAAVETDLADIDFVTVEGTIDTGELSNRFAQSFRAAKNLAWAKPVFASVELQRQELLNNGNWSDWKTVPRIKVDDYRNRFNIPQKISKLDKSIEILMLQFDTAEMRTELLQPDTYDFAYPAVSWLPPNLALKRQEKLDKLKLEDQKKRREEARKAEEEKIRTRAASRTTTSSSSSGASGIARTAPGSAQIGRMGQPGTTTRNATGQVGGGSGGSTHSLPTRKDSVQSDTASKSAAKLDVSIEEQEFAKAKITDKTDFAALKDPLLFWAHDDTAEAGKTYKYRIRIGVFNPIAGTNSFKDRDKTFKEDVILWSNYSNETEPVTIQPRWYFFPQNYRDTDKMVNMRVCRYLLAKWYSKDFRVKPGEVIGAETDTAKNEDTGISEPNNVNFANGTVLVDVVPVLELDKNYANALFAFDSKTIEQIAVKQQYWPSELKTKFEEIARLMKDPDPIFAQRSGERLRAKQ